MGLGTSTSLKSLSEIASDKQQDIFKQGPTAEGSSPESLSCTHSPGGLKNHCRIEKEMKTNFKKELTMVVLK